MNRYHSNKPGQRCDSHCQIAGVSLGKIVSSFLLILFLASCGGGANGGSNPEVGIVSAGGQNVLYVKPDGTLWEWGSKEVIIPTLPRDNESTPSMVGFSQQWVSVAALPTESFGVKSNGTLWTWGVASTMPAQVGTSIGWAVLDASGCTDWATSVQIGYIIAEGTHVLALKVDGSLWAWGDNSHGQLGDGTVDSSSDPVRIGTGMNWSTVSAGLYRSVALKDDQSLWMWGGVPDTGSLPARVGTGVYWIHVDVGYDHTAAIHSDGSLWTWGDNDSGQLGNDTYASVSAPAIIASGYEWKWVSAGRGHSIGIQIDGTLWSWGNNRYGSLGDGTLSGTNQPVRVGTDDQWMNVLSGDDFNVGFKTDGSVWTWGNNFYGQLGLGTFADKSYPVPLHSSTGWQLIDAGAFHTVGVQGDDTLQVWGVPQLMDDTFWPNLSSFEFEYVNETPSPLDTTSIWKSFSTGSEHSLAVKSDGTLWAWGDNQFSQLGTPTLSFTQTPVRIGTGIDWTKVSAGGFLSRAIRTDGTLWEWGIAVNTPSRVGTGTTWDVVSAGLNHTLAQRDDGSLYAWGGNGNGQLGTPLLSTASTPVRIGTGSDWAAISAGIRYSLAVRSDGSLWSWGENINGQLGNGTFYGIHNKPAMVGSGLDWSDAAAGTHHSAAIKTDGSLWTWGANGFGQLGDGILPDASNVPGPVGTATNWQSIDLGWGHTVALKEDGSLWVWGYNGFGQLGDGTSWKKAPQRIF